MKKIVTNITELSQICLMDEKQTIICENLFTETEILNFSRILLSNAGMASLASVLGSFRRLRWLSLRITEVGEEGLLLLCSALGRLDCLSHLELGCAGSLTVRQGIPLSIAIELAAALRRLKTIHVLIIGFVLSVQATAALVGSFEELPSLSHLVLASSSLSADAGVALAPGLERMVALQHLDLSRNPLAGGMRSLAPGLKRMTSLRSLELSRVALGEAGADALAPALADLVLLQYLDLSANGLGEAGALALAPALSRTRSLHFLLLGENGLGSGGATALAGALSLMGAMVYLDLSSNWIGDQGAAALAPALERMANSLWHLDFEGNNIGSLGAQKLAAPLASVRDAHIRGVFFHESDRWGTPLMRAAEAGDDVALRALLARGVSARGVNSSQDTALDLARKKKRTKCILILSEHLSRTESRVRAEFAVMQTSAFREIPVKVLVVGSAAAGKTTLIRGLASLCGDGRFRAPIGLSANGLATDGVDTWELHPPSEFQLRLSVWDFGGQHVLYPTHRFFLTDRAVYMLVADLSCLVERGCEYDAMGGELPPLKDLKERAEKMLEIRRKTEEDVSYWAEQVAQLVPAHACDRQVVLIGTHADRLKAKKELNRAMDKFKTLVTKVAPSLRNSLLISVSNSFSYVTLKKNKPNMKTSNNNGNTDVLSTVAGFANSLRENSQSQLRLSWVFLKVRLAKIRERQKWIWWKDFVRLAAEEGVIDESGGVESCASFLVSSGEIVSYRHRSGSAPSLIVLDPEWLTRAFSSIVTVRKRDRRGVLGEPQLRSLWGPGGRNYPENTWNGLLQLLALFQLVVELPGRVPRKWVVPCMILPRNGEVMKPELVRELRESVPSRCVIYGRRVIFRGGSAPHGFLGRLLVRLLHFPGIDVVDGLTFPREMFLRLTKSCALGVGLVRVLFESIDVLLLEVQCAPIVSSSAGSCDDALSMVCAQDIREGECGSSFATSIKAVFLHHLLDTLTHTLSSYFGFDTQFAEFEKVLVLFGEGKVIGSEADILARSLRGDFSLVQQAPDLHVLGLPVFQKSELKMLRKLGRGAFGEVRLVKILGTGETFALKTLIKQNKHREFLAEVLMMSTLATSPDLASARGVVMDSRCCGVLMDFADRGDLTSTYAAGGQHLTELQARHCMLDVARGMNYVHTREFKLIHRDLRSPNVFLFSDPTRGEGGLRAKVADFGECVLALPVVGKAMQAWQWMAPEAWHGAGVVGYTQAMDVYSFAIVSWEMLAAAQPFKKESFEAGTDDELVKRRILNDRLRPEFTVDTPPDLMVIIERCWHHDPALRPSFGEIVRFLEEHNL